MGKLETQGNAIVSMIKKAGKPVSKKEILAEVGAMPSFYVIMKDVRKTHPEIKKLGVNHNTSYVWEEEPKSKDNKNAEGYSDKTAGAAIKNIMRQSPTGYPERQKFGEFWRTGGNNEYEGILVVAAKEGMCIGCFVHSSRKGFMKDGYTFNWYGKTGRHWCSTLALINFQTRNITTRIEELDEQKKTEFRNLLAETLGYEVTKEVQVIEKPVEVEKIVEKEVPVEVEKVVEKKVGMTEDEVQELLDAQEKEFERKLLEQKVSIYEKVLFRKGA